ncbi:MAG: 30S ribosomal protein S3 [Planctomycetes bacterium]|nr:30S ribosomal protein S3 [Planctomycetota bacterium]
MGQKVCPTSLRVGVIDTWRSRWYADKKHFGKYLVEDARVRRFIKSEFTYRDKNGRIAPVGLVAQISRIIIERTGGQSSSGGQMKVYLYTARPGIMIGRKGERKDELKEHLRRITGQEVDLEIVEVKAPELEAQLVAEDVASQLMRRVAFRRAIKRAIEATMQRGALGIRVRASGRLGGREMAQTEVSHQGSIPLSTLTADVDYGFAEAHTTYSAIGVKVWVYRRTLKPGEKLQDLHVQASKKG